MLLHTTNAFRITALVVFAAVMLFLFAVHYGGSSQNASGNLKNISPYLIRDLETHHNIANLTKLALEDKLAQRAVDAVRASLNSQRLQQCPTVTPFSTSYVTYLKKRGVRLKNTQQYFIEITFDDVAVFFAVIERTWNASGDTEKFVLISSVPGPCELEFDQQLAVSMKGKWSLNRFLEIYFENTA